MKQRLTDVLAVSSTIVLVLCALVTTGFVVRKELAPGRDVKRVRVKPQPDWQSYAVAGHRIGPPDAKLVFVEFADFQCPACKNLAVQLQAARIRDSASIAIVYKNYPLTNLHPYALPAAIAAECAARQSRFHEMHDALYSRQALIGQTPWSDVAGVAGVPDIPAFVSCMSDSTSAESVARDRADGDRLGVQVTPTLLVNGYRINGGLTQTEIDSLVRTTLHPDQVVSRSGKR